MIVGTTWRKLAGEARGARREGDGWLTRRIFPQAVVDIFAAYKIPDEYPALMLEVSGKAVPANTDYPHARGFEVLPQLLKAGSAARVRLCLVSTERHFGDLFEVLAEDIALCVSRCSSEVTGVRTFLARLRVWQGFMAKYKPDGLTLVEQAGLWGELWFLRENVLPYMAAGAAVASWLGPGGGLQDFSVGSCGIELKTSTQNPPARIHVDSLAQLDESALEALLLVHVATEVRVGVGESLVEIIDGLRSRLQAEDLLALDAFNSQLLQAGYSDSQSGLYADRRLSVRAVRFFRVVGSFPRIRTCDVAPGILDCHYEISFAACLPFELDQESAASMIYEGIGL